MHNRDSDDIEEAPKVLGGFLQTIRVIIPDTSLHTFAVLVQTLKENGFLETCSNLQSDTPAQLLSVGHTCTTTAANEDCRDVEESPLTLMLFIQAPCIRIDTT